MNYPKHPFKTDCQFIVCLPKCLQKSAEAIRNPISSKADLLRFSNGSCVFLYSWLFLLSCYTAGRKAEAGKHFPGSSPQTGFWKHLTPNICLSTSPISVCWWLHSLASSHPSEDGKIKVFNLKYLKSLICLSEKVSVCLCPKKYLFTCLHLKKSSLIFPSLIQFHSKNRIPSSLPMFSINTFLLIDSLKITVCIKRRPQPGLFCSLCD